ncbi:MAG TPA: N-acetylmuramidase domain-containing protein [Candidatus Paceibacterota bacterium]
MSGDDVLYLQKTLNTDSATKLADSGPGSPGNETNYFGSLTEDAIKRFQTKYVSWKLFPDGYAGPVTIAKLNQLITSPSDSAAPINEVYTCIGGSSSWLGFATSGPYTEAATGKPRQDFQSGYIGWDGIQQYAFNTRSVYDRFLAPVKPICVYPWIQGTNERTIADSYNRIGGQLTNLSTQNILEPEVALAVWKVESSSIGGFAGPNGQPTIRFENHKLWDVWVMEPRISSDESIRRTTEFNKHFNNTSSPSDQRFCNIVCSDPATEGKPTNPSDQAIRYEALAVAERIAGQKYAYYSISIGGPQIMGFNCCGEVLADGRKYYNIGYGSPKQMFDDFSSNEFSHVRGFFEYMKSSGAITYVKKGSPYGWSAFSSRYNGDSGDSSLYQNAYNIAVEVMKNK